MIFPIYRLSIGSWKNSIQLIHHPFDFFPGLEIDNYSVPDEGVHPHVITWKEESIKWWKTVSVEFYLDQRCTCFKEGKGQCELGGTGSVPLQSE